MGTINKRLGERIKELRELTKLRQKEVAGRLGVSRSTISQIENGDRKISAEELHRILIL